MVLEPINMIIKLKENSLLLKTLNNYDKILFLTHFHGIINFINPLEKIGFTAHRYGAQPSTQENLIYEQKVNFFSNAQIIRFFNLIIDGKPFNDAPRLLNKDVTITYLNKKNHSLKQCIICNHSIPAYKACAETKSDTYCSIICLLKKLDDQEHLGQKLSNLFDKNYILTNDEKLLLKQFGALCYLRAALLMPSIAQEYGIVYQLPLSAIIHLLRNIENATKDTTSSWAKTVQLAKYWGIKIIDLKLFLSVYKITKQDYLQTLLKRSLNKSYDNLEIKESIIFDEKDHCTNLQKTAFINIKKALELSTTTKDISLIFLYNELIELINKRVGLPLEHIETLLTVTTKQQDLTNLLQFNGYTDNPFSFKLTTEKKDSRYSTARDFNDEESSDEDIYSSSILSVSALSNITNSPDHTSYKTIQHKKTKKIRTINSLFEKSKPYTISLFNARKFVPQELQEAQTVWKNCTKTVDSTRVKTVFALADSLEGHDYTVATNEYGSPHILCNDENYDISIREKLDLDHLFSRHVDTSLHSYGIAERVNNLIQVSIPGEIIDDQGKKKVGFFQYSYTRDSWVCIHRCFKSYDANQNDTYISSSLRKILCDFLKELDSSNEYSAIIKHLEELLTQGK